MSKNNGCPESQPQERVALAVPCGADGSMSVVTVKGLICAIGSRRMIFTDARASSALTHNFNNQFAKALNARAEHGVNRFVMMHSDIAPCQNEWLDILLDELNAGDFDVLSVVSPIKNTNGLSSTGLDTHPWRPRRLTMHEIDQLPETFTDDDVRRQTGMLAPLLINTGLMAIRLDRPWVEAFPGFDISNRLVRTKNGFVSDFEPEDWKFSRWCNSRLLRIGATRKVKLQHFGTAMFQNWGPWGTMKVDETNAPEALQALYETADTD